MTENTKQNIIDAAIFTFNEDLSAPLEQVAAKAGVTRRTLHRYFKDRKALLICCNQEMQKACSLAMKSAQQSSNDPLEQLKQWLFAAIDCGVKYAFLHKLHHLYGHEPFLDTTENTPPPDPFEKVRTIITTLQDDNIVSKRITFDWISVLFLGIVTASINSLQSGTMDNPTLKSFAWYSFSKGIGV